MAAADGSSRPPTRQSNGAVVRPWRAAVEPLHYRFFKHEMAYMNVAAAVVLYTAFASTRHAITARPRTASSEG